jgi:hypothetical protein
VTIDELRALQDREQLRDRHLVELRADGFTLAHTDQERLTVERGRGRLEDCAIHRWLTGWGGPAALDRAPGIYLLRRHVPDTYSEPLGAEPYELEPLTPGPPE